MKAVAKVEASGPVTLSLEVDCGGNTSGGTVTPPPPPPPPTNGSWTLNADLTSVSLLTASAWHKRIDDLPAHSQSLAIITAQPPVVASLGRRTQNDWGPDFGMPYAVGTGFPNVPVTAQYSGESDLGPHPIPLDAPIEGNGEGDAHLLYFDTTTKKTYELFLAKREGAGFSSGSVAVWDSSKSDDQRELGWTSADAAGLPILPGLVRFDEFSKALSQSDPANQHLGHALRFTLPNTGHGFIEPARHYASLSAYSLPTRPPMGMRIRIKKSFDISGYNQPTQVLLRTLQLYGAILADNGASFFFSGTRDERWSQYWDAITGNVDGKPGFKSFAGTTFDNNVEVVDFTDVITQV